jgi:hypothetical protein
MPKPDNESHSNAHQIRWAFGFPIRCSIAFRHVKALRSTTP